MLLHAKTTATRFVRHLRVAASHALGWLSLTYYSMPQVMLRAGAFILVAIPVAELAIGMDVITTVAVIAPEWGACAVITLAAIWLWRRSRRRSDDA